jgi:hypothetical protein
MTSVKAARCGMYNIDATFSMHSHPANAHLELLQLTAITVDFIFCLLIITVKEAIVCFLLVWVTTKPTNARGRSTITPTRLSELNITKIFETSVT